MLNSVSLLVLISIQGCILNNEAVEIQQDLAESINSKLFPYLTELLQTSYFRYYKINLSRPCPFWEANKVCTSNQCTIITEDTQKDIHIQELWGKSSLGAVQFPTFQKDLPIFRAWDPRDFCQKENQDVNDGVFVDLIKNPERFTGFSGNSATAIWSAIYQENCFGNISENPLEKNFEECIEKRVFYRVISGMHASISTHIASNYYFKNIQTWGQNPGLFWNAVGNYPERLSNLYFTYNLVLRAISRLRVYLMKYLLQTGNDLEDSRVKYLIHAISSVSLLAPVGVETQMFKDVSAKTEFKNHFRNVSRIMDCVECEKCRLWGTIQITGLGTAMKILFSFPMEDSESINMDFQLERSEIVAIFNTLGRLSNSINEAFAFRDDRELLNDATTDDYFISRWIYWGLCNIHLLTALMAVILFLFHLK